MAIASNRFAAHSPADVVQLVLEHPLAWIVSNGTADPRATLLPLRPELDASGRLVHLVGHFARSNDHVELLRQQPRALILVLGAQGYVSPSWMQDRTQAPTWNYASAHFVVNISFFEEPGQIEAHLHDLVGAMEAGRPNAWSVEEMGARYAALSKRVIGFRAQIEDTRAKFKLGQDERDDVFRDIAAGLADSQSSELLRWVRQFNPGRG